MSQYHQVRTNQVGLVTGTRAQLGYQRLRLEQYQKLASTSAGTRFQVQETEAKVKQLEAELETAEWNLKETAVSLPRQMATPPTWRSAPANA